MSRALRVFTDYFIKGLGIGTNWWEKAEDRELKKQQAAAQLAHWRAQADWRRDQLAEQRRRNDAYITQSGAYADYLRRKGTGRGGAVAAGGSNDAVAGLYGEFGVQSPQPPAPAPAPTGGGDNIQAPSAPPGDGDTSGGFDNDSSTGMARGGRVRANSYARGGAINTSPMGRFASGVMGGINRYRPRNQQPTDGQTGQPLSPPVTPPIMPTNISPRVPTAGAGTTGPGSGYGEIAAPPPPNIGETGYQEGGRITDTAGYKAEVSAKDQARRDEIRDRYEGYWRGRQGMREWAERSQGAPDWSRYDASSPPSAGGYRRGGRVHLQGGGTPTPRVRDNLPVGDGVSYVDDQGRLVDLPIQDYERADPRYDATRISVPPPMLGRSWERPPGPPDLSQPDVRDRSEQDRARRAVARRADEPQQTAAAVDTRPPPAPGEDPEGYAARLRNLGWRGQYTPMPGPFPPRPDAPRSVTNPPNPADFDAPSRGSYEQRRRPPLRGGGAAAGTEPDVPPQGTPQLGVGAGLAGPGVGGSEDDRLPWQKPTHLLDPSDPRYTTDDRQRAWDWAEGKDAPPKTITPQRREVRPQGGTAAATEPDVPPQTEAPPPQYTNQPAGAPPKGPTQYGPGTEGPPPRARGAGGGGGAPRQVDPRDKAFDPSKAPLDPRSGLIIDANGQIVGRLGPDGLPVREAPRTGNGAISTAPPVTSPQGGYGMNPQGSNVYGAGLSSNSATNDYNYAIQGASNHAKATYGDTPEGKLALAQGHGAATPVDVDNVFKIVDPDNKLPPHEKMIAATKAVHDFHMAKGDQKAADAASFAITQFGNQQAKQHGAEAMKALQKGDTNGAMNQLMAGYGWIPDSGTPHYDQRSNSIVVTGPDGKVGATIPVQPGTLQNLSLGMMSGQLAWDVIHSSNGAPVGSDHPQAPSNAPQAPSRAPPAAAPPVAQPQAAPAGPAASPPAATPQPSPPGSAAPMPSPQATNPPPATTPAMSPQTAATQPPPAPPPAPTPPAPTPLAATLAPPSDEFGPTQAIQITAPTTPPAAPSTPPAGPTPTAGAAAPPPPPTTQRPGGGEQRAPMPEQGGGEQKPPTQKAPEPQTPEQKAKAASDDQQQKHWDKDPYAPLPQRHSETAAPPPNIKAYDDRIAELEDGRKRIGDAIVESAARRGLISRKSNNLPSSVTNLITAKRKEFDDLIKQVEADRKTAIAKFQAEEKADREETKPIRITPTDNANLKAGYKEQREAMAKEAKTNPTGDVAGRVNASPLRYAGPNDSATIDTIATQIYAQNSHKLTPDQAYELALQATSIMPPSKDIPDPVGLNRQKGGKATKFQPIAEGQRASRVGSATYPNTLLRFGDGTSILVDAATYSRIVAQHQNNWKNYEQNKDKKSSWTPSWSTAGAALRTVAPMLPIVGPVVEAATRPRD